MNVRMQARKAIKLLDEAQNAVISSYSTAYAAAAVIKRLFVIHGRTAAHEPPQVSGKGTGAASGGEPARFAWPMERSAHI